MSIMEVLAPAHKATDDAIDRLQELHNALNACRHNVVKDKIPLHDGLMREIDNSVTHLGGVKTYIEWIVRKDGSP